MITGDYEVLERTGFKVEQLEIDFTSTLATVDFGDGYGRAAIIGSPEGLRSWSIKIDVLPDTDDYPVDALEHGIQSRATYLWEFFRRQKSAGNQPCWVEDLRDGKLYLAEFTDHKLSYQVLCGRLYSTGLQLRQRRSATQESPIDRGGIDNNQQI
jgi:hypothetical protein